MVQRTIGVNRMEHIYKVIATTDLFVLANKIVRCHDEMEDWHNLSKKLRNNYQIQFQSNVLDVFKQKPHLN